VIHGGVLEAHLKFDPFFFLSSTSSDHLESQSKMFLLEQSSSSFPFERGGSSCVSTEFR
jgi:hypothetical protein